MDEQIVVTADQSVLAELVEALESDDNLDRDLIEYENPETPGQLGEPITIAILLLIGAAVGTGVAQEVGKRSAGAIWDKVGAWRQRHHDQARFARRDAEGTDHPMTWEEAQEWVRRGGPGQAPNDGGAS
jgi:hypothetical protein